MEGYQPLGERKHWLQDDYVKFIRFAQTRIERTGYGIVAFITNHGYLSNPTFRGMRQSLIQSFDEIYVLDLHGNARKKEQAPDGSKDENVFDIQQGVAIAFFIKHQKKQQKIATVYHAQLWGVREIYKGSPDQRRLSGGKYHWLWENDFTTTQWTILEPKSPYYLFVPQNDEFIDEYSKGWKVTEIMGTNTTGILSARDHFVVDFNDEPIKQRIRTFLDTSLSDKEVQEILNLSENYEWRVAIARKQFKAVKNWESHIKDILYRPFDIRRIIYDRSVVWRVRTEVMQHMLAGKNLALITNRQVNDKFQHILCTNKMINDCTISLESRERSYLFPLYLYPSSQGDTLFEMHDAADTLGGRRSNFSPEFIEDFSILLGLKFVSDGKGNLQQTFGPEDVFSYMYAVFHSPTYRERYTEFLKRDFPRLPLTSNADLFRVLCELGDRLVVIHLMEKYGQNQPAYNIKGTNVIDKVNYRETTDELPGRVYINKEQYFDHVPSDVWNFHVGGFQVCHKWLKDRKGHTLSFDNIKQYQRIVAALAETITLMEKIDEVIDEYGGWPIS